MAALCVNFCQKTHTAAWWFGKRTGCKASRLSIEPAAMNGAFGRHTLLPEGKRRRKLLSPLPDRGHSRDDRRASAARGRCRSMI